MRKFTIDRRLLADAIGSAAVIAGRGPKHSPLRGMVRLWAGPDGLEVRARDSEIDLSATYEIDRTSTGGAICVDAGRLREIPRASTAERIELEAIAGHKLRVIAGGAAYTLAGIAGEDWPIESTPVADTTIWADAPDLRRVFSEILCCVGSTRCRNRFA